MRKVVSKNPLFFAFFFPASVDAAITLVGQDQAYWTSRVVNEASPAYYALLISPWLFAIGSIFWFAFWYWVFKKLKEPLNLFLVFLFVAGHSWGSTSWIWKIMRDNGIYDKENQTSTIIAWVVAVLYFVVIAGLATYCLRVYMRSRKE